MLLHVAVDGFYTDTAHVIKFRGDILCGLEALLVIKSGVFILHREAAAEMEVSVEQVILKLLAVEFICISWHNRHFLKG